MRKSTTECHRCSQPPSQTALQWITLRAQRAGQSTSKPEPPAGGSAEWEQQPNGKRNQAKARKRAAATAASTRAAAEQEAAMPPSGAAPTPHADVVGPNGDTRPLDDDSAKVLAQRIESAQLRVREFEAVGESVRGSIPDFDELLRNARAERDRLVQERKALRPIRWRLVEAEQHVNAKKTAVDRSAKNLADLRAQLSDLRAQISDKELEHRKHEQELADARVTAEGVRAEITSERSTTGGEVAFQAARCLLQQVEALPNSIQANNAAVAVQALHTQLLAVTASLSETFPAPHAGHTHEAAQAPESYVMSSPSPSQQPEVQHDDYEATFDAEQKLPAPRAVPELPRTPPRRAPAASSRQGNSPFADWAGQVSGRHGTSPDSPQRSRSRGRASPGPGDTPREQPLPQGQRTLQQTWGPGG